MSNEHACSSSECEKIEGWRDSQSSSSGVEGVQAKRSRNWSSCAASEVLEGDEEKLWVWVAQASTSSDAGGARKSSRRERASSSICARCGERARSAPRSRRSVHSNSQTFSEVNHAMLLHAENSPYIQYFKSTVHVRVWDALYCHNLNLNHYCKNLYLNFYDCSSGQCKVLDTVSDMWHSMNGNSAKKLLNRIPHNNQ